MIHEIGANGVVSIHGKCDFQFRADTIDARHQDRRAHTAKIWGKQSSEPADFSKDLRSVRGTDEPLNAALEPIAQINIHTGSSVSFSFPCHVERSRDISNFRQIARDSSTSLGMTGALAVHACSGRAVESCA